MSTLSNRWNAKEEYPKISISGGLRQKDVLKHSNGDQINFKNFLILYNILGFSQVIQGGGGGGETQ